MTQEQMKEWIDNASYQELLMKWRFAAVGDPFFQGEIGDYYSATMAKRRAADPANHVRASKAIG